MALRWAMAADYEAMGRIAAERMFAVVRDRLARGRPMLLGLATGKTMLGVYERFVTMLNEGDVDLSLLHTVNLDEYVGADGRWIPENHPLSYRGYMAQNFFSLLRPELNMKPANIHFPEAVDTAALDAWVLRMGGLDFQLLGLGFNGHIGFNEPVSEAAMPVRDFAALPSRVVALEDLTIETNARLTAGGDRSAVPGHAATLGMRTILAAKEIMLLACFPQQRRPLGVMLEGAVTPELPGSYLNEHPDATVVWAENEVRIAELVSAQERRQVVPSRGMATGGNLRQ